MRPAILICRFLQSTYELLVSMARNRNKPDPKRVEVANFVSTVYGTDGALLMRMIEHKYGWCRRVFAVVNKIYCRQHSRRSYCVCHVRRCEQSLTCEIKG